MIVAAVCSYGAAINLARPLQMRSGALPVVWRTLGVAAILTAPLGLPALLDAHWTTRSLLSMLALGAFGTAIANVIMTVATGRLGAARASATVFLIPVVALVFGVAVRGEHVAPLSIVGAAVCLAGAWLIRPRPARARAARRAPPRPRASSRRPLTPPRPSAVPRSLCCPCSLFPFAVPCSREGIPR